MKTLLLLILITLCTSCAVKEKRYDDFTISKIEKIESAIDTTQVYYRVQDKGAQYYYVKKDRRVIMKADESSPNGLFAWGLILFFFILGVILGGLSSN
jgi:hypothetical protein